MELRILSPAPTQNVGNHKQHQQMDVDDIQLVTPGETVTTDQQFMRGHGTYTDSEGGAVISSVAGAVDRVNKLLSVRPLKTRYTHEIGDIVVGRITEVATKRWKVDVNGRQDAVLLLSSINLPGGVQRRKTEADELQIRQFFAEGDVLVAEVQQFYNDELILGLNGFIWVYKKVAGLDGAAEGDDTSVIYSSENDTISEVEREGIARVSNCIAALAKQYMYINDTVIASTYEASQSYSIKELLKPDVIERITVDASAQ